LFFFVSVCFVVFYVCYRSVVKAVQYTRVCANVQQKPRSHFSPGNTKTDSTSRNVGGGRTFSSEGPLGDGRRSKDITDPNKLLTEVPIAFLPLSESK